MLRSHEDRTMVSLVEQSLTAVTPSTLFFLWCASYFDQLSRHVYNYRHSTLLNPHPLVLIDADPSVFTGPRLA